MSLSGTFRPIFAGVLAVLCPSEFNLRKRYKVTAKLPPTICSSSFIQTQKLNRAREHVFRVYVGPTISLSPKAGRQSNRPIWRRRRVECKAARDFLVWQSRAALTASLSVISGSFFPKLTINLQILHSCQSQRWANVKAF